MTASRIHHDTYGQGWHEGGVSHWQCAAFTVLGGQFQPGRDTVQLSSHAGPGESSDGNGVRLPSLWPDYCD